MSRSASFPDQPRLRRQPARRQPAAVPRSDAAISLDRIDRAD
jgi:hypothetical protein